MNKTLREEIEKTFLQTVKDLRNDNEIKSFLEDILGEREYEKLVKKLAIIYWTRKERSNENIKNNLEVTKKEIDEAVKIINKKGIKTAIRYMEAEEWANVWSEKIKKLTVKKL